MTVEELNSLVENAYEAAFDYEDELAEAYRTAFVRASDLAAKRFSATVVTASEFVPPPEGSLTSGMTAAEQENVDRIRNDAAAAIAVALAAVGLTAVAASFMEAIAQRGALNFEQEILLTIRNTVQKGLDEGWTAERTALALQEAFRGVTSTTATMLAQTELTTLVNERSLEAAQKTFQDARDPVYKTWETMKDARVRVAHATTQGQTVPISQPFDVGGYRMMYPGDPSAPLQLTARCRCRMSYTESLTASAKEDTLMGMNTTISASNTSDSFLTSAVTITIDDGEGEAAPANAEPMADGPAWRALLAVEGVPTEDGRMLEEGSLTWRDLPLTLQALDEETEGGHLGARVAGRIDRIWRDGNEVWGEGVFNSDEFGMHIFELVSNQSLRGNSIDPAVLEYEYRDPETMEVLDEEQLFERFLAGEPVLTVFLKAVILKSTIVSAPAIEEANIILASGVLRTTFYTPFDQFAHDIASATIDDLMKTLTAAAAGMAPLAPPLSWFEDPRLDGPTPLTVTPEGHVFGHAALWNSCHIGEPSGPGICVPPPRSGMQYEVFHHGVVTTEEGVDVPCGQITMSTLHAGRDLGWKATLDHYENSGCAVADVVAGEDRHGIWVTGGLRPDLPAERVREMKAGALSGDWRQVIGRGLEFIAALVVNIPGFPIPRPEARIVASAAGEEEVLALVAAGIVEPEVEVEPTRLTREQMRQIGVLTR